MSPMTRTVAFFLLLCTCVLGVAEVRMPFVFTHHMVLQRDTQARVWGWAAPGERVVVSFDDQEVEATAGGEGRWSVELAPLAVGEPRELRVEGSLTAVPIVVRDVLVGDVWIASGQSNMEWSIANSHDGDLDRLAAKKPRLRLLRVKHLGSQEPLDDIDKAWRVCDAESLAPFSAVAYHFGLRLNEVLDVPIGLVDNSWGASSCEAWVPREKLEGDPLYEAMLKRWAGIEAKHDEPALRREHGKRLAEYYAARATAYAAGDPLPPLPWVDNKLFHQQRPANLYNARVAPLLPMAIRGAIWYQGESNAWIAHQYRELFPLMIRTWREAWGRGEFPFYWAQLADFQTEQSGDSAWAELREAQTMTLDRLPNTGQAVLIDIGEANDIHPRDKRSVGQRLARLALAEHYGLDVKARSPRFEKLAIDGGRATVTFTDIGAGLKVFDGGDPVGFHLAGEDRVFHPATARLIDGKKVELTSERVRTPVAVRYAWGDNPRVNLYDSAWLPVTPFRTDDWPGVTHSNR